MRFLIPRRTATLLESIFALRKILLNIRCIDVPDKRDVNRFNVLPPLTYDSDD